MKIALAQLNSIPGDFASTVEHMLQSAEQAQRQDADLIVFPASLMSGAYPLGLSDRCAYQLDLLDAIDSFAERCPIPAAVPAYVSDDSASYTEIFLCAEGCACPLRRREASRPGNEQISIMDAPASCTISGVSLRFLAGDSDAYPDISACDVALSLVPIPYNFDDTSSLGIYGGLSGFLMPLSEGIPCWFVAMQGVGAYDDVVFAGGSFALAPSGIVAAACPLFEEGISVFDAAPVAEEESISVEPIAGTAVGMPLAALTVPTEEQQWGYLYRALVIAVRDYVRKSGFADVIVGLSGGIDSAMVAAISADALGAEHVLGILMPGPYSSEGSLTDAHDVAERLGIATRTVSIAEPYEVCDALCTEALDGTFGGTAAENLQARLRGTIVMTLANARGALVMNTGNKSESGMGYSTLYGDTVGAYAPLTDIYKGNVYELARWRNAHGPGEVIPQAILEKAPSAELSEGQTDEGSLGMSYKLIDTILDMYVDRGYDAQDIIDEGIDPAVVRRVIDTCMSAEYKRHQEPLGPVVSFKPFVDLGWPLVLKWRDHADVPHKHETVYLSNVTLGDNDEDAIGFDVSMDSEVDEKLDEMLMRSAHQDQVVGMVSDVAFGTFVSGRGPDMDDCLGMPLFSKN